MGSEITEADKGIYAYRSSKTALNLLTVSLAKELGDQGIALGAFCPGWVSTRMGGEAAPVTPAQSVSGMRVLIGEMNLANSGQFRRYLRAHIDLPGDVRTLHRPGPRPIGPSEIADQIREWSQS